MRELWIASNNPGKGAELERLLTPLGYRIRPQSEAGEPLAVVEDRPDFAGNAELKALALAVLVAAPALGDDSGLCVDALNGLPGVRSARWAGPDAGDGARVAKLLAALEGVPPAQRTARFVCHLCLADAGGQVHARIERACEGIIAKAPRGTGGFGYDPVFVPGAPDALPDAPTFAELTPAEKDAVSHRGAALRGLVELLQRCPLPDVTP